MTNNYTALAVGANSGQMRNEFDNAIYDMSTTSGTMVELLQSISNYANWTKSNTTLTMPSGSFTVTGSVVTTPNPPVAIDASNILHNSFSAKWNSSSGATKYFLDVSEANDFSSFVAGFENLDIGNVTSKTVTPLNPNTPYHYRVRANNSAGTSISSNTISVSTVAQPATTVQFKNLSGSVSENGGSFNITVSISNPDAVNQTTANIVLVGGTGDAADINNYTTQTVTFPAGNSTDKSVTLVITDDGITEGNETLIFEIQNVSGGNAAVVGTNTQFSLSIIEQTGGDYYENIDPNLTTFIYDLKNRIRNPYTWVPYSQHDETNIANFASKDNGDGSRSVFCVYSNYEYIYSGTFTWERFK